MTNENIIYNSNNGHYYQWVSLGGISWNDARDYASSLTHDGMTGYLATVTTSSELDWIDQVYFESGRPDNTWIGASDSGNEGTWSWLTGPEGLANDGDGTPFYSDSDGWIGSEVATGGPNYQGSTESGWTVYNNDDARDFAMLYGWWEPLFVTSNNSLGSPGAGGNQGILIEYGGLPSDDVNSSPTGTLVITGIDDSLPYVGQYLYVDTSNIDDADGFGSFVSYYWYIDGVYAGGGWGATTNEEMNMFPLTEDHIGKTITVRYQYYDSLGNLETVFSAGVEIPDVNTAPEISSAVFSIAENRAANSSVGSLIATDEDDDTLTYSITAGNTDVDGDGNLAFKIDAATGAILVNDAGDLDFEVTPTFALTVRASDGVLYSSATATVNLTDVAEAETPGVSISGSDTLTGEDGGTAVFSIKLDTAPVRNVTVVFAVSDSSEAQLSTYSLTFTSANWNVAQSLTVTGLDDYDNDGNVAYNLTTTISTRDLSYIRVTVPSIALSNSDDAFDAPLIRYGTNGIDYLTGNNGADRLYGLGNMDEIIGGRGNDRVYGDYDDDFLYGGDGNDWVYGGYDDDLVYGDAGDDEIYGEAGSDSLQGGTGDDYLDGGTGADTMVGGIGNDTYLVDNANDVIDDQGAASDDDTVIVIATVTYTLGTNIEHAELDDTSGASSLMGNRLNNELTGNRSKNALTGGTGKDSLSGGGNNDTFVFKSVSESATGDRTSDIIKDFRIGSDKISLSTIDAFASSSANDTFIWKGTAAFNSTTKGEVRYEKFDNRGSTNDYTMVWIDNDRDTSVEMAIRLTGLHNLTASDFIL